MIFGSEEAQVCGYSDRQRCVSSEHVRYFSYITDDSGAFTGVSITVDQADTTVDLFVDDD
jgi:hypothetical protein